MTQKYPFLILLPIVFAACSTSTHKEVGTDLSSNANQSEKSEVVTLVKDMKVSRTTLSNGLRLLVLEDHSSPTFAYQTWYRVGSRDETPGRTGLAHLFEHMMFKETRNLKDGEFDRLLEGAGAQGENAFTSRDYTAYIQELPSDKLELIVKAEADRMVNLVINQKAFKTEREVVQNERRFRNENSADGLMDQELFSLAFSKHPYHWPIIGYQEDLDQMTDEDALKFYDTYYSPNRATVVIVGDVTPAKAISLVEKYYGHYTRKPEVNHDIPQEPAQTSPRRKQLKLNIQVEKLLMGYHLPRFSDPDIPAVNVLQNVLAGGKSSRLSRALIDTGLATSVEAYDVDDKDPSLFIISANLQQKKHATQAEIVILKEIARLAKDPISEYELRKAKNKIDFAFYDGLESNYERARFLGHFEAIAGDFREGIRMHEKMRDVTAQDVQRVAKRYLDSKNRTVITGVSK